MAELPCNTILYRSIRAARDFQDGRALSGAFMRRESESGLSVDFDVAVPDGCGRRLTKKYAIVSLHCGKVRDLGLSVLTDEGNPDVSEPEPNHAEIRGVPLAVDDDSTAKAENIAAKLVEMARTVWEKPRSMG